MLNRAGIWPMMVARCFSIASRESFGSKMWRITATPPPKRTVPSCSVVQPTWEGGRLISIRSEGSSSNPTHRPMFWIRMFSWHRSAGFGEPVEPVVKMIRQASRFPTCAARLLHPARQEVQQDRPS